MMESLSPIADILISVSSQVFVMGVIAFAAAIFLRKPNKDKTITKNFAYVEEQKGFFSSEIKVEAFFPFFNAFMLYVGGTALIALMGNYSYELLFPEAALEPVLTSLPFPILVLAVLMIVDLMSYLAHRFMHRFLWYYHAAHHAAEEISWMTSFRLHPLEKIIFIFTGGSLVGYLFGTNETVIYALAIAVFFDGLYNMFVHMNLQLEYPKWLRYILVSPNMHRWHHARDDVKAYDQNFATVFSFYDVLLGTYYVPEGRIPEACGVDQGIEGEAFPRTFLGQVFYPFKWHAHAIKHLFTKIK